MRFPRAAIVVITACPMASMPGNPIVNTGMPCENASCAKSPRGSSAAEPTGRQSPSGFPSVTITTAHLCPT